MGKNSLIKSTSKKTKKVEKETKTEKIHEETRVASSPPEKTSQPPAAVEPEKAAKPSSPKASAAPQKPKKADPVTKTPTAPATPPAAVEPPVTVTYDAPSEPTSGEAIDKTLLILAGCVLFLFILVIGASAANHSRYYVKKLPVGIEIQQGKFAPLGEKKIIALPDISAPEEEKTVYERNDVYPLIFKHYLNKADALLAAPGIPDYENIKAHLAQAQNFAVTNDLAQAAARRVTAIDLHNLLYRAGVAQDQDTVAALENALDYLAEAGRLEIESEQTEQINRQQDAIRERLRELKEIEAALEAMPKEAEPVTH